jgi:Spy/CpxP family protein refolding chaperone
MKTNKFYLIIIVALLCCNLVLVFFLLNGPQKGPNNRPMGGPGMHEPKRVIIDKLHFDDTQIMQYEEVIKSHFEAIRGYDQQINELKKDLYIQLKKSDSVDSQSIIINKIGEIQQKIERKHFDHFLEIKKICRPDQMKDFDSLSEELVQLFDMKKPPR